MKNAVQAEKAEILDVTYWRSICPMLSIDESKTQMNDTEKRQWYSNKLSKLDVRLAGNIRDAELDKLHQNKIKKDGYCAVQPEAPIYS